MAAKSRNTTMRDVAQHAGVSIQTVSCVVNGTGSISDETRGRVLESIEALNFRRNPIARSMRTQRTGMIALVVMDITNPVLARIAGTVESAAYGQDYNVVLYNTGLDAAREKTYLHEIGDRRVDGAIIVNAIDRQNAAHLEAARVPAVLIDCALDGSSLPTVSVDNIAGAVLATEHLIALGHRRIAHIGGASDLAIARQREQGYRDALAAAGLEYQRSLFGSSVQWGFEHGYLAMQQLLADAEPPTSVFAASDELAIGAYRALTEAGLRVPDDLSVVGFDDIDTAAYVNPPLTTIHQPFAELGLRAFAHLLAMLDGEQQSPSNMLVPARLVIRDSTARASS